MNIERQFLLDAGSTSKDYIFGDEFDGKASPIEAINSECQSAIVAGSVEWLTGREFKEERVIFFDISDETHSILAKALFRDKNDYLRALDKLKTVERIQVQGYVQFDEYRQDFVLFAKSAKPVSSREDTSKTKRVELHVHTQMSEMDSVIPTGKLIQTASRWGWDAIAITDHGVVQAFPKAMETVATNNLPIKVIYGMEGNLTDDDCKETHANHIMILAKNEEGLRNLYKLVSLSHLQFFHHQPRIPKHILEEHRNGLLFGASACVEGELVRAIAARRNDEELLAIADFYDYLEIQPIGNCRSLIQDAEYPCIHADEDLRNINRKITELAKKLGKILVATGNVHFLNPEDAIYRTVIQVGKGINNTEPQPPLYLRTTEEMLKELGYLGEDTAYEAVVTNPRLIANMIDWLKPIPDSPCLPTLPNADELLKGMAYQQAHQWYGENLPAAVQERLDLELDSIIGHGFSVPYLIAHKLVEKSNADGYPVGSRGAVGSSFVATMMGLTEVNPLPPHWRCIKCQYSEFITDGSYGSGFDLPNKNCPNCGKPLLKDGQNIPAAVFLGFDGDKMPDIALNFAHEYLPVTHSYIRNLFGDNHVYHAGSITVVTHANAYGYTRKYFANKKKKRGGFIQHILKGCIGTKRATGQHPTRLMIIPEDMDIHCFTPIQHPADSDDIVTHFDYHDISDSLIKLDIHENDVLALVKMLQALSHCALATIPFDDSATLSLFRSLEALGISPEELGTATGTLGIPEFRTDYLRQMLAETQPTCFDDLVKISALSHGTDVWLNNGRDLIRDRICTLRDVIATRDDILMYLLRKGIEPLLAFKTMENVSNGNGIQSEDVKTLKDSGVPEWYIESCQKIKYLFPRAHVISYVMMAYRVAYYKVHYPITFYKAYFSLHSETTDTDVIPTRKEAVQKRLKELGAIRCPNSKQRESMAVLQLALEMYLRGYEM